MRFNKFRSCFHIQEIIDRKKINGHFILTGSQSLLLSEKISQTLARRTAILKLLPFSMEELAGIRKLKRNSIRRLDIY